MNKAISEYRSEVILLTRHNRKLTLFGRMGVFLQVCATEAEAYALISATPAELFPTDSGALFMPNPSRDMLEVAATWRARPPGTLIFPPEDRLPQRRGMCADNIGLGIGNLKLRDMAIRDPFTGLFNRRCLEEALAREEHRTRRNRAQLAAIVADINDFKQFNDRFGHDGGDAVLPAPGGSSESRCAAATSPRP